MSSTVLGYSFQELPDSGRANDTVTSFTISHVRGIRGSLFAGDKLEMRLHAAVNDIVHEM